MLNGRGFGLPCGVALLLGFAAAVGSAAADEYRYDALGRLIGVTYSNGAVVYYSYDAAGSRTAVLADTTGDALDPNNHSPVAVNDSGIEIERYTTGEIYVLYNDSDPDGDPLTITGVTGSGASIGPDGKFIIYAAGAVGLRTLQYTVSDGRGGSTTASVQITVTLPLVAAETDGEGSGEGAGDDEDAGAPSDAATSTSDPAPGES